MRSPVLRLRDTTGRAGGDAAPVVRFRAAAGTAPVSIREGRGSSRYRIEAFSRDRFPRPAQGDSVTPFRSLHPDPDAAGPAGESPAGGEPLPVVRNAGDALTAAAGELAERGVEWKPPESVESIGVLGYRLWFTSGPPGSRPGPHPIDVRPDGTVRFFTA